MSGFAVHLLSSRQIATPDQICPGRNVASSVWDETGQHLAVAVAPDVLPPAPLALDDIPFSRGWDVEGVVLLFARGLGNEAIRRRLDDGYRQQSHRQLTESDNDADDEAEADNSVLQGYSPVWVDEQYRIAWFLAFVNVSCYTKKVFNRLLFYVKKTA